MTAETTKTRGDIDAEVALLGSMLLNADVVQQVRAIVTEEDFVIPRHRSIFRAVTAASGQDEKMRVLAVADALLHSKDFDGTTVQEYLTGLLESAAFCGNAGHFARIVRRSNELRL